MDNTKSTTTQNTIISQLDKANEVLKGLAINVTSEDRKQAEKKLKISRFTITPYLKGGGTDLDTAMLMIDFFSKRIEERDRKIEQAESKVGD